MFGIKLIGQTMLQEVTGDGYYPPPSSNSTGYTPAQIATLNQIAQLVRGLDDLGDGYYADRNGNQKRLAFDSNGNPYLDDVARAPKGDAGPGPVHETLEKINGHYVWVNPVTQEMTDTGITVDDAGPNLQLSKDANGNPIVFNPKTGDVSRPPGSAASGPYGFSSAGDAQSFASQIAGASPAQLAALQQMAAASNATGQSVAAMQYQNQLDQQKFAQQSALDQGQLDLSAMQLTSSERVSAAQIQAQLINAGLDAESARRQAYASVLANRNTNATNLAQTSGQIAAQAAQFAANPRDSLADLNYRNAIGTTTPYADTNNPAFGTLQNSLADAFNRIYGGSVAGDLAAARQLRDQPIPADFTTPVAMPSSTFTPTTYKAPQIAQPAPVSSPVSPAAGASAGAGAPTDPWAAFRNRTPEELAAFNAAYNPAPAPPPDDPWAAFRGKSPEEIAAFNAAYNPQQFAAGGAINVGGGMKDNSYSGGFWDEHGNWIPPYQNPGNRSGVPVIDKYLQAEQLRSGRVLDPTNGKGRNVSPDLPGNRLISTPFGLMPGIGNAPLVTPWAAWSRVRNPVGPFPSHVAPQFPALPRTELPVGPPSVTPHQLIGNEPGAPLGTPQLPSQLDTTLPVPPPPTQGQMQAISQPALPAPSSVPPVVGGGAYKASPAMLAAAREPFYPSSPNMQGMAVDNTKPLYADSRTPNSPTAAWAMQPKQFAAGGNINLDGLFNGRAQDGYSPSSSEGGTNLNLHERAVVVGESGHIYATLGEKRPDGTIRAEQLMIKPLKSEVTKDKKLEEQGKSAIEMQKATLSHFDQGGTVSSMPDEFLAGLRKQLSGIDPQAQTQAGQLLPSPRLLGAGVYRQMQLDPVLNDYIHAGYSQQGIADNALDALLKQYQPVGYNTQRTRYQ